MDEPTPITQPDEDGIEERRAARRRWELAKVARAQAQIDSGYGITGPELYAWLDAMANSDQIVPPPPVRRLPPRDT
jgi:hypothetical protein